MSVDSKVPGVRAQNILEIEDLKLAYLVGNTRIKASNGVTLHVREGEAVGIVGESGSGKSTIARAVLGLLPEKSSEIESGKIVIGGTDVTNFSPAQWEKVRGNPVAIVFQDPLSFLNPVMRISRQIGESVRHHDPGITNVKHRIGELLELVKLPLTAARAFPHELSGGMRQRAMMAIALGCRPRLLVADEPTTALDVTTQAEIMALLRDLRERLGMAMMLISHDLGVIASACERIYVMYAGRTVEWGETSTIFSSPAHPYTQGLLQAAKAERDARGRFETIIGDVPNLAKQPTGCPFEPRCPKVMDKCPTAMPAATALDQHHAACCYAVKAATASAPAQAES